MPVQKPLPAGSSLTSSFEIGKTYRFSGWPVAQGRFRFYMSSVPSKLLASASYVSPRQEDPILGFQRFLDKKRAQEIAEYIDSGLGTIPQAVVLSAQEVSKFDYINSSKLISFTLAEKAFLIIDGQHRIFGFKLAKQSMRVPVIVYSELSRIEETKLFIDINTKQKPVPTELLLDIKRLAEYEDNDEELLRIVFDSLSSEIDSPLAGKMSPNSRVKNFISRVTFNGAAINALLKFSSVYEPSEIIKFVKAYLNCLVNGNKKIETHITNPTFFRAIMDLMADASRLVAAKYGKNYTERNYLEILRPFLDSFDSSMVRTSGRSNKMLYEKFKKRLEDTSVL